MLIKKRKSGQATIVLIVVTMMTVLGVAVASSSQSRINLRDTVYSTQSVQALSCAEAGADRSIATSNLENENIDFDEPSITLDSSSIDYAVEGCDGYEAEIQPYPSEVGGEATILNILENSVQEFNTKDFTGKHRINFSSNNENTNPGLAIYRYYADEVERTMVYCNYDGSGTTPDEFIDATNSSYDFTLDDGTVVNGCSHELDFGSSGSDQVSVRIRPLFADATLQVENFQHPTGYKIVSTGISGQVQRDINIIRFFSQLSGSFDETVVSGGSILND